MDEDAPWRRRFDESAQDPELVNWRQALQKRHGVGFFALDPVKGLRVDVTNIERWSDEHERFVEAGEFVGLQLVGGNKRLYSGTPIVIETLSHESERLRLKGATNQSPSHHDITRVGVWRHSIRWGADDGVKGEFKLCLSWPSKEVRPTPRKCPG